MNLLGAKVEAVKSGSRTLKDALNEALRDWVTNVEDTFYVIGSVAGPHPYPVMVRDLIRSSAKNVGSKCPKSPATNRMSLSLVWGADPTPWGFFTPTSPVIKLS